MLRYSFSFLAVIFMIAVFIAYWIMHVQVHTPNSTIDFLTLIVIFLLGAAAGVTATIVFIRTKEEAEEEKK